MGLGDRLKDIRKQAETAVSDRRDQIVGAVETIGTAANEKTSGKYADKIAKVGGRVTSAVDKIGAEQGAEKPGAPAPAAAPQATEPQEGAATNEAGAPAANAAPPEFG